MRWKPLETLRCRCSNLLNRLISWVLRISNYKLPMPSYKQSSVKDQDFLLKLAHQAAYRDLCLWVAVHRDKALDRLLSSNKEDREEYIGQVNAYEKLYRELIVEVARVRNLED